MRLIPTDCCALCQLSAKNDDSVADMRRVIDRLRERAKRKWHWTGPRGGERTVFVMTTPNEAELEGKLVQLGFEVKVQGLPRRNGYPEGTLKMWMLSF